MTRIATTAAAPQLAGHNRMKRSWPIPRLPRNTSPMAAWSMGRWVASVWSWRRIASTRPIRYRRPGWDEITEVLERLALSRRQRGHRGTWRRRRTVRSARRRRVVGHRRDEPRSGRVAVRLRRRRAGAGFSGCGPAAAAQADQPGRALPRDGAVLRRQRRGAGGRGDDDLDRVDPGQSGRRAAGRLGSAGAAGACAGADDDRDRRQLADAGRRVHRLAVHPPAGVGPDGLRAMRADPGCQR